jgi:hypothetical protein
MKRRPAARELLKKDFISERLFSSMTLLFAWKTSQQLQEDFREDLARSFNLCDSGTNLRSFNLHLSLPMTSGA